MRALVCIVTVFLVTGSAFGQITDPVQRKDWSYLQTLAKEAEERGDQYAKFRRFAAEGQ